MKPIKLLSSSILKQVQRLHPLPLLLLLLSAVTVIVRIGLIGSDHSVYQVMSLPAVLFALLLVSLVLIIIVISAVLLRSKERESEVKQDTLGQLNRSLAEAIAEQEALNEELNSSNEELHSNLEALRVSNEQLEKANATIARQKDEQLNRVLEFSKDIILSYDLTGQGDSYLSRSAHLIFQQPYEEVIKRPYFWRDHLYVDDVLLVQEGQRILQETGKGECTYRILLNEEIRWLHEDLKLIRSEGESQRLEGIVSDITESYNQNSKILLQRNTLRMLIDNLPSYITVRDTELKTIISNKAHYELLGATSEDEVLGKNLIEYFGEAGRELYDKEKEIISSGRSIIDDEVTVSLKGSEFVLSVTKIPIRNEAQDIVGLLGIYHDVTEQHKKDADLIAYKKNLEIVFNNSSDNFLLMDRDAKVVLFNKRYGQFAETYAGVAPHEGMSFYDVLPESRRAANEKIVSQVLNGEFVETIGEVLHQGGLNYFSIRYQPVYQHGVITHITLSALDITKQKKQELAMNEYRTNLEIIVQRSMDTFILLNPRAEIIFYNQRFEEYVLNIAKKVITPKMSFFGVISSNREKEVKEIIAKALKGESVKTISKTVWGDVVKYYDVTYSPVITDGSVSHITVISSDVTEQKQQEIIMEEYRENLDIIFKTTNDTFLLINAQGQVVLFNHAFERFIEWTTGVKPRLHDHYLNMLANDRTEEAKQLFEEALLGKSKVIGAEFQTTRYQKIYQYLRYEPIIKNERVTHVCISGVDVTEFKNVERELKQQRYFLEKASESAKIGYWTCEPNLVNGKVTWSKQLFTIFNIDESEFTGRVDMFNQFIHPEDRFLVEEAGRLALTEGIPCNVDHRIVLRDGTIKWVNENAKLIFDNEGNPELLVGITQDISARKTAESQLKQDHYFLEKASESAHIGYWTSEIDFEKGKLTWSKEVFNIFQMEAKDFDGLNSTFFDFVHPEERTRVAEQVRQALEADEPYNVDHRIVLHNGDVRWVNERAQILRDKAGKATLMVGVIQDINDRKIAEDLLKTFNERYRILSEATNDVIWDWDIINDNIKYNLAIRSVLGYEETDVQSSEAWWRARIHPDDCNRVLEEIKDSFAHQLPVWNSLYQYRSASGHYKYINDRASIVYDGNRPIRMIGAMQDVSEVTEYRMHLERKVEERTSELNLALQNERDLVSRQKKFVVIASHEFRTPLSSIALASGFIKKYASRISPEKMEEKLLNIEMQIGHMTELLDDLLTVGKAEAGTLKLKCVEVHLSSFLEQLVSDVTSSRGNSHRVQLKTELDHDRIFSDEGLLRNIIINLLTNAIKFSPDKRLVDFSVLLSKGNLQMKVRDYGIGIPREDLEHLFEPFYRGQNITEISGTGLGLSILKKAVELLHGEVVVESELGKGTLFIVNLNLNENTDR